MCISKKISILATLLSLLCLTAKSEEVDPGYDYDATRFQGDVRYAHAFQQNTFDSFIPPEGNSDDIENVSRKFQTVLQLEKPGEYSVVFDGQYIERPYGESEGRINQFNATINLDENFKLRLGKQRTLWGRGFAYVPTDFINPPLDPSATDVAKIGVPAVSLDYISTNYALTMLVSEEEKEGDSAGIKWTSNVTAGADLDLIYYSAPSIDQAFGISGSIDAGQILWSGLDGFVFNGGISYYKKSRYPLLEENINSSNDIFYVPGNDTPEEGYVSYLLGLTYQSSGGWVLISEWYHIDDAYTPEEFGDIRHSLGNLINYNNSSVQAWYDILTFGRIQQDYYSLSLGTGNITEGHSRLTDNLGLEFLILSSLDDDSYITSVNITSTYWSAVELMLRIQAPFGDEESEFGIIPYEWHTQFQIKYGF